MTEPPSKLHDDADGDPLAEAIRALAPAATGHALPDAATLDAFRAEAEARIFRDGTREATRRAYAAALRYWDAWHRAALGRPLPLLADPPQPVPGETVRLYVVHHAPRERDGSVTTWMPQGVRDALARAGVLGHRRVARARARPGRTASGLRIEPHVCAFATLRQRIDLLAATHGRLGLPSPLRADPRLRALLAAVRALAADLVPEALSRGKSALKLAEVEAMAAACGSDPEGLRDRALLLVAFHTGGRRRSEVVGMDFAHLRRSAAGWTWHLPRTKTATRTEAAGSAQVALVTGEAAAALAAWLAWLAARGITEGAVFRRLIDTARGPAAGPRLSARAFAEAVVRRRALGLGLDPERDLGGHSLRSGFATSAMKAGAATTDVMAMTGHRDMRTFLRYYQPGEPEDEVRRVQDALDALRGREGRRP